MLKLIEHLEERFLSLLLVSMTLIVLLEVIMRFGFNSGFIWMEEVTLTLGAWFVLFGASYGVRVGAHIGVDAFVKILPDRVRHFTAIAAVLLCMLYSSLLMYGSWVYLAKLKMIGIEMDDLPIEKWIVISILFIGFLLLNIRFLQLLISIFKGEADGLHLADEAKESMHLAEEIKQSSNNNTQGEK